MKIINSTNFISILVGSALYMTIWSYIPGKELQIQLISLGFMVSAGFFSFLISNNFKNFTLIEVLFLSATMLSLGTSWGINNSYSMQYSIIFSLFCLSLVFIVRILNIETIVKIYCNTLIFIIISVLLNESSNLAVALSIITTNTGLFRFTPLGMHPNLSGMVYGGSAILLAYRAIYIKEQHLKILYFSGAVMCIVFVLASSARGSLLALLLVFILWLFKYVKNLNKTQFRNFIIISLGSFFVLLANIDKIFSFLSGMLDLESSSRGISSGGTGRFDLWQRGVQGLLDDPIRLLFGYGLRTSGESMIGFSLESSYLTLLYEFGLIMSVCLLIKIFLITKKSLKISSLHNECAIGLYYSIGMSLFFLIFQSIFNRYLIAIGNFYSIFFIMILFKIEIISLKNKKLTI